MGPWTRGEKIALWSLLIGILSCPIIYQIFPQVREWINQARPSAPGAPPQDNSDEDLQRWREARREEQRKAREEEAKAEREEAIRNRRVRDSTRKSRIARKAEELRSSGEERYHQIILRNKCLTDTIFGAVRYFDLDDEWVTQGWWTLKPGASIKTDVMTRNGIIYFFAESAGGAKTWNGDGSAETRERFVAREAFLLIGDEPPLDQEQRKVSFFQQKIEKPGWVNFTQSFGCSSSPSVPLVPKVGQ